MIYLEPSAQKNILSLFHFGLATNAHLFLGPSETTGALAHEFDTVNEHWKIYRKKRDVRLLEPLRQYADGMGDALVNQLTERKMVKDVADIYKLTKDDLLKLERMGDKSAQNVLNKIERSKKLPLERVIYGLGIRFVGARTAQFLAEHFGSMEALASAGVEELQNVNEVGPRIAESIVEFFSIAANRKLVERLGEAGLAFKGAKKERGTKLAGKTFVLTGTLARHTRDEAKKMIEECAERGFIESQ